MKRKPIFPEFPHMLHGGDYNPDQWQHDPHVLEEDMRLFKLAGCNEMSLGIFAWAALEPREGEFDFTFMDRAMDDIYKAGGRVILATPSAARPIWLAKKYPEVLRCNDHFERNLFGRRHNHCYTSPIYREKVAIINRKLAERYKDHPALLGWHVSNEYNGRCWCPLCQEAFREYLKNKYQTLDALNRAWWSAFWSHTYTDWSQIDPPSPRGEMAVHGLTLEWKRFCSHQTVDFLKSEIAVLKEVCPDKPVTTNLMAFHDDIDYHELSRVLDFVSYDIYPPWRGADKHDIPLAKTIALYYDHHRSMLHQPFILMECTPSTQNWRPFNKLKAPGFHMLASMQAVAHGSDSVLYFQFRKSRGSSEKFHGAVIDHEGSENTRVFREVKELGERLKGLDALVGTYTKSEVALVYDWSNRWMLEASEGFQNRDKKLHDTVLSFYGALWDRGINTDIIGYDDDFSRYKLLIAPMLYSMSEEVGKKFEKFVAEGGHLLATYTTAMVNETDLCYLGGLPGAGLRRVFGIWNEEIDTLYPDETCPVRFADGEKAEAVDYCEHIHSEGAEVLAYYDDPFYAGTPAATRNSYGKGEATYIAFRDTGSAGERLLEEQLNRAGVRRLWDTPLPYGVTVHSRYDEDTEYLFLQNFSYGENTGETAMDLSDLETGEKLTGKIRLAPMETRICVLKH